MRERLRNLLVPLALACGSPAGAAPEPPLLPPDATVVLLSGLPGDVEHETRYAREMDAWLEWLANAPARPRRLVVLANDPGSVTLPAGGEVLPASREALLKLTRSAGGPLFLVAWGHGGLQGTQPVFHVRGPRILPADLAALAAGVSGPSRWILYFRGSGAFASALKGAGREVLASEAGSSFASDPVGMSLLLAALRNDRSLSFTALAEEVGRRTRAYYEERHLARLEEPALFSSGKPPRLLITAPARKPGEVVEPQPSSAAAWKEIARVEAAAFPRADAVVLRRRQSVTVGSRPALTVESEDFVQLLTPEGKRFGDFDLSFSPPEEDLAVLDAEVMRRDGTLLRLDPADVREAAAQAPGEGYPAARRKLFSLPGVEAGAILRVRTRASYRAFPLPHVCLELPVDGEAAVADAALEVIVARESAFHAALVGLPAREPDLRETPYGTSRTWRFRDVPARPRDVLSPPGHRAALLFSTFPDWAAFAGWYRRISRGADEVTPEIAAKAAELTRGASTAREKVRALSDHVTSLRYVAVPLGVSSFRPHAAANVLRNGYGDCKDKASLLNALLRAVGIEAHLVLVPRFSDAHEAVPGLSFNHAISRVTLPGETLFLDTTDDVSRFGFLPPGDPGRRVLVIDGVSTTLTRLPEPALEGSALSLRQQIDLPADPLAPAPARLRATATGFADYVLRAAAPSLPNVPLLSAAFRPAAGVLALARQEHTSASRLDADLEWSAEGDAIGLLGVAGAPSPARTLLLRPPFWLPSEWELALGRRASPLHLNQGYPLALRQEILFQLPPGVDVAGLPAPRETLTSPLRFRLEWSRPGPRTLQAALRAELLRAELTAEEAADFQRQLADLHASLSGAAALSVREVATAARNRPYPDVEEVTR